VNVAAEQAAERHIFSVIPSEARNQLFLGSREEKQIPRFARDDKEDFFRNL
jgi:hypothetical protein